MPATTLTPLQQGMLFNTLFSPQSGVDIEQLVVQTTEALNYPRFQAAWQSLLARHPMLRTRFLWEGLDTPMQEAVESAALFLESSTLPLTDFLRADRLRGFRLDEAPLLRVTVLNDTTFVWSFHHAILDGRCYPTLLQELHALYTGQELEAAPTPFAEFVAWQEQRNTNGDESFWRPLLKGFRAPTPLTVERLGDVPTDSQGHNAEEVSLSKEATQALAEFATTHDLTLNTLVQGAWGILLSRYSGEEDIVFGAVRACRHGSVPGSDSIMGPLINTLPVRVQATSDTELISYLAALRAQHMAVRPFEHASLAAVQALSDVPRGTNLFDSLVMFDSVSLQEALGELPWKASLHEQTSFPLTLMAYGGSALSLKLSYDATRFSTETAQRLLGHLSTLLASLPKSAGKILVELPLLTDSERMELSVRPAENDFAVTDCLHTLFEAQAARTPDALAVTLDGVSVTYAELNARANRLAHKLQKLGVGPETLVGLLVERSVEIVVGILGILKAGGAYLPIDVAYPADRAAFMLEDAEAPVLLTQRSLAGSVQTTATTLFIEEDFADEPSTNPTSAATPDSLLYVIYTSGSTGKPKGVQITHRNVGRLFASTDAWFGFDSSDVWTLFHSHAFDFTVWELWGALLYGGRLVVVPYHVSRDPNEFLNLLRRERVTVLNQTPSAFRQMIAADGENPGGNALRYVVFGGEALDLSSLCPWIARHGDSAPKLINMYGITETCVHVTYRPLTATEIESARGSVIGVPIPDLSLHVLQPGGEPTPIGVPGELFVGGAGLARGYLKRPELTAERFQEASSGRLYKTGDLARRLPDGDIEYLGRIDQQVQLRGFRIELGEIESALSRYPGVSEAVVLMREDQPGEQRLVAYLVASPRPEASALREALGVGLPPYMIPSAFLFLEALPLTTNGKTDKKALPAPAPEARTQAVAPPRNATEATLQKIWQEVLRQPEIGIHDSFFERGGDSILVIHVLSKARQAGLKLSVRQIFENPTIAELAELVGDSGTVELIALPDGPAPPTPIQKWFFDQNLPEPNFYNQAFAFTLKRSVSAEELDAAIATVTSRHDVLKLGFAPVETHNALTEEVAFALQSSLDYTNGPIGRAALSGNTLLVVLHHLATDGVSWRVFLEDLEAALLQRPLPAATHTFGQWANAVGGYAPESERTYWEHAVSGPFLTCPVEAGLESDTRTHWINLTEAETQAFLKAAPAFGVRPDTLLLTALNRALGPWLGNGRVLVETESHGREEIIPGIDVSRTMGWFTAIYPVALTLDSGQDLLSSLTATKAALETVPNRGIGYGVLKDSLSATTNASILFNFLGQLDGLCAGSELFALSSDVPTGPWHGPTNSRSHGLDILAAIKQERLEVAFGFVGDAPIPALAERFAQALRELLAASEKPIPYPLSPMQKLFASVHSTRPELAVEQWKFALNGPVDAVRLRKAWEQVVQRHGILRSTFTTETQSVQPEVSLPWSESEIPDTSFDLETGPLMKLGLIREAEDCYTLYWNIHHLLLDGWSWPLVFSEVAALYGTPTAVLPEPIPFRRYIDYLQSRGNSSEGYWRSALEGVTQPTPLPASIRPDAEPDGIGELIGALSEEATERLTALAANKRWTLSTLVQGAWGLVLAHHARQTDVLFGASFSGRPEALAGALEMVGPMVVNLPVRVRLSDSENAISFLDRLQKEHVERVEHQDASPLKLQSWTQVPLRYRLFDSLVVFQNYQKSGELKLGNVGVELLSAPDHTAFPLTLVAMPGTVLSLKLAYHRSRLDGEVVAQLQKDLNSCLHIICEKPDVKVADLLCALSEPLPLPVFIEEVKAPAELPKNELEQTLARIWQEALGVDRVGRTSNFFDLGAHSLLLVTVHGRICAALGKEIPLLALFAHPTIAALAAALTSDTGGGERENRLEAAQSRAQKQREALLRQRQIRR